jgi:sec-independent protein translocase protein TatB
MQMFGIGILELMVIFVLAIIVIGPDRLPQFAADLAKWIRRTRAYANHMMRDFNDVMGDLEKEVGASREDWKEIASVVTRNTGDVTRELTRAATQVEKSATVDIEPRPAEPSNVVNLSQARPLGEGPTEPEPAAEAAAAEPEAPAEEEKPWFVPERTPRRRSPAE